MILLRAGRAAQPTPPAGGPTDPLDLYRKATATMASTPPRDLERRLPAAIRIIDRLSRIAAVCAALALAFLSVNVIVDVIGRTLFRHPFAGTLELTSYWWMPALVVLSFGYAEYLQEHIKVTLVLDALPRRFRQIVEGTIALLGAVLLLAVAYFTLLDALHSLDIQQASNSKPPIAIWPFKFVAVAGAVLIALQLAATAYRYYADWLPAREAILTEADVL